MPSLRSLPALLLLSCYLCGGDANRVYVHPFSLFAFKNAKCENLQTPPSRPLVTLPTVALDPNILTPDARDPSGHNGQRQNITDKTVVLAELLNSLGVRMYQIMSSHQPGTNSLLSPVNTYGSLVTFLIGASKRTAAPFQSLLGLSSSTDREDCVSLVEGHKVLETLQSIYSVLDDGPKDEISTQVWAFTPLDTQLSTDFIQGTQDFSDASYIRGVDFSKPEEAEQLVNEFVEKTSGGKLKSIFKNLNSSANLLFISSFTFQGSWRMAFQPERISMQEFYVDETITVMAPLMTHTGRYHYLNDTVRQCMVVKLSLSNRCSLLLVLPHEGVSIHNIELTLITGAMSAWYKSLQEVELELSLPRFSLSSATNMRDLLTKMDLEVETRLLGSQAEFSQLSNTEPFTIDQVVSKASFEMSEEGIEPQDKMQEAGTAQSLSINRPFFFSLIEENSNAILLLGKVTNPTL